MSAAAFDAVGIEDCEVVLVGEYAAKGRHVMYAIDAVLLIAAVLDERTLHAQ